jgi:8-oxo-dGTP diphosphatase
MRDRFKASVSVFAIVRRDDRVLMVLRSGTGWMDGYWSLPAGAMDGGEVAPVAAARELREEVSIVVASGALVLAHTQQNFTHGDEWLGLYFEASDVTGSPAVMEPDKHAAVEWFAVDTLPAKTVPYVRMALEAIQDGDLFSTYADERTL